MTHRNFFTFSAASNYELGVQMGESFRNELFISLNKAKNAPEWVKKVEQSEKYIEITKQEFTHLVEELQGHAVGAGVDFLELWTISLEDELDYYSEKCTTIVTNNGMLISHNEDWAADSHDAICLIKKSIKDLTIFEFFYYNTLGGNSISINSHGVVQSINSLAHTDWQIGIPRTVTTRWFSETADPKSDYQRLKNLKRSIGYNHVFIDKNGSIFNLESTSKQQELTKPQSPFVHTNHYLGSLKEFEAEERNDINSTFNRFEKTMTLVKPNMSMEELIQLNSDTSDGEKMSIFNKRTIGKMIIDIENKVAKVWMKREEELGWIDYDLKDFFT